MCVRVGGRDAISEARAVASPSRRWAPKSFQPSGGWREGERENSFFFWPGLCLRAEAGGPRGAFSSRKRPRVCEEGKEFRSFSNGKGEQYW